MTGKIKYYEVSGKYNQKKTHKGSIILGPKSSITRASKDTMVVHCHEKDRDFTLIEPSSTQVNFN